MRDSTMTVQGGRVRDVHFAMTELGVMNAERTILEYDSANNKQSLGFAVSWLKRKSLGISALVPKNGFHCHSYIAEGQHNSEIIFFS